MLDDIDRLVVTCLVDNGYQWSTIWDADLYPRAYAIMGRLVAARGALDDVVYQAMPTLDADLAMILADWLQTVHQHRQS